MLVSFSACSFKIWIMTDKISASFILYEWRYENFDIKNLNILILLSEYIEDHRCFNSKEDTSLNFLELPITKWLKSRSILLLNWEANCWILSLASSSFMTTSLSFLVILCFSHLLSVALNSNLVRYSYLNLKLYIESAAVHFYESLLSHMLQIWK